MVHSCENMAVITFSYPWVVITEIRNGVEYIAMICIQTLRARLSFSLKIFSWFRLKLFHSIKAHKSFTIMIGNKWKIPNERALLKIHQQINIAIHYKISKYREYLLFIGIYCILCICFCKYFHAAGSFRGTLKIYMSLSSDAACLAECYFSVIVPCFKLFEGFRFHFISKHMNFW